MCRRTEVFILGYEDISLDDRLSSFLISYHLDLLVVVRSVVCDILLGVSAVEEILDLVIDERLDSNHGVDNFRQIGDDYTFILTGEI